MMMMTQGCSSSRVRAGSGVVRVVASTSLRGGLSRLCPALPPDHPGADPASQAVHKRSAGKDEGAKEACKSAAVRRKDGEKSREILENVKTTFLTILLTRRSGTVSNDVGATRGVGGVIYQRRLRLLKMSKTYVNLNLIISERSA